MVRSAVPLVPAARATTPAMPRVLALNHSLVVLAIAGCLLGAGALFACGVLAVVRVVWSSLAVNHFKFIV